MAAAPEAGATSDLASDVPAALVRGLWRFSVALLLAMLAWAGTPDAQAALVADPAAERMQAGLMLLAPAGLVLLAILALAVVRPWLQPWLNHLVEAIALLAATAWMLQGLALDAVDAAEAQRVFEHLAPVLAPLAAALWSSAALLWLLVVLCWLPGLLRRRYARPLQ